MKREFEEVADYLKSRSIRLTTQRRRIIDEVFQTHEHFDAEELFMRLAGRTRSVSRATVYRTLDLLARMGIVTKLSLGDGQSRYEFKSSEREEHHHHLICTHCGKIINYSEFLDEELRLVKKTEDRLAKKYNFKILDHNIEFLGLCKKCQ